MGEITRGQIDACQMPILINVIMIGLMEVFLKYSEMSILQQFEF